MSLEWKREGVMDGDMLTEVMKEIASLYMLNRMRVISLHDQRAGEVSWEVDSRDS